MKADGQGLGDSVLAFQKAPDIGTADEMRQALEALQS
jgi:hypothetical protein